MLILWENAVDVMAILHTPFGVNTHGLTRLALPGQLAIFEPGVGRAITQIAAQHLRCTLQVSPVPQIHGNRRPTRPGMRAHVIGTLLMGRDQRLIVEPFVAYCP
jgi:hypothetical protein